MATHAIRTATSDDRQYFGTASTWDPRSQCRFIAAHPDAEPELWSAYLDGARTGYRKYGAESALEYERMYDGRSTALFFVAIAPDGTVAGGLRAQGPYHNADEAHATVEWSGRPGAAAVQAMIRDRIPFGVVEMKAAWVADGVPRRGELTRSLAGIGCRTTEILDVQFLMATAAEHVLELWESSGGVVATHIPPTPYPDGRYLTRMMWWDRTTLNGRTAVSGPGRNRRARLRAPRSAVEHYELIRLRRSI
ncbi:hypothetical protein [Rhodococcus sp. NPDC059234]|uniref:hypothetical protein n=1 Tax=Rhodococcus sp. NPDC059234 TaxID=3346781 RepID=UPI0036708AF6